MPTNSSVFLKSAVRLDQCPQEDRPEVAFLGRSNSGKSSLINALTGRKTLAKVSSTPGKTRILNFFDFGPHYRLVEMPGYGFASRGGDEQRSWQRMIEDYLGGRQSLVGLVLIMDIRREMTEDEEMLMRYAQDHEPLPLCSTRLISLTELNFKVLKDVLKSSVLLFWFQPFEKMGLMTLKIMCSKIG